MFFQAGDVGGYDSGGRGPYDDFWYGPVPGKTTSGVRVNDDTAMRLAVLYACVNVISQDLAKVPLVMFRREKDGGRSRVTDHPVVKLLQNPARNMTAIDWKQRLEAHQLLRGNSYCEMRTDFRGRVRELAPLKPDYMRVEVLPNETLRYHYRNPSGGPEKILVEGEVLHFRGLSLDGPLGLSPIDQAKETLGEAVAAQAYGATFFANDARPGLWLEHPSHFKDETQKRDWLAAFKRAFGGGNRFSPMLTEYGIKIHELPPPDHAALQFLELRKLKGVEICAIYRVPPHKVAILDKSTNNNIEHQGIEYVTDCLLTWCRRWEERLAADLLTESEREEYYFEFLLDALMRGDTKSRFDAYSVAGGGPWLLRNEIRQRENMDAVDGFSDPIQPVNMAAPGAVPATGATPPDPAEPAADDPAEARGRELELQARRRTLNRETRALSREWERTAGSADAFRDGVSTFYAGHASFVAEALALPRDRAERYCFAQCEAIEEAIDAGAVPQLLTSWQTNAEKLKFTPLPAAQPRKE
jgi:HK97 family phage portal protein